MGQNLGFMWLCCGVVRCGLGFVVAVVVDECADDVSLWTFGFVVGQVFLQFVQ
jgi:hypothetical protein